MTPRDWQRLRPLFEQALALPIAERAGFVEKVCLEDEVLAGNLAELLEGERTTLFGDEATLSELRVQPVIAGRFRILRQLGRGGMGEVFEAEDLQLNDHVALKMIRPEIASNSTIEARFKREILLGKRITHPNVCRIHDLGSTKSDDGVETLFLTMEFLQGETLAARIKRGTMSADEARPLIANMSDGLAAAHQAGVVHRDFKSGNVMLVESSQGIRAVITDFGLAQALRETDEGTAITKAGTVAGSVGYMAPEQIRGERVTAAADIYSLGVVMFEMVTGRRPFLGNSDFSVALQHLNEPPPLPRKFAPHLDANWEAAIVRCLSKAPEERFGSPEELKAALLPGAAIVSPAPVPRRRMKRLIAPILILILLAASIWAYRRWNPGFMDAQQRIAVLEFENVGGDPVNRAFCEGLMETLSSQLTEIEQFQHSLAVVPASEIRRDNVTSTREARRDFGVNLVITGSVQRSAGGTRLTINVVDARQLKQLRSHAMFIPDAEVSSMQQGVITEVAQLLDIQLRPDAQQRLAARNTPVPGAYASYLRGAGYLSSGRAGVDPAIEEFRQALERDPSYALAHAGLGQAYWAKYSLTKEMDWVDRAWRECRRSIELGPQLSEPHITLAILNSGTGHYDEAIREAKSAIQIDPRNDRAYSELARALDATGQSDAAEATIKKAIELRPDYWYNYVRLGIFYGQHGRYKEAEVPFRHVIALIPNNPTGYTNLAAIYHLEGRNSNAEEMLKRSIEARPTTHAYSDLATVYFFERRYADAVPIMEKLVADGTRDYNLWGNLGDAYRWTPGNREKSAKAYERAIGLANEAINVNPHDAAALSGIALYQAKSGQTSEALQMIQKALSEAPGDKEVLFDAAVVFELAGERARALQYIRSAIIGGYSASEIAIEPELDKLRRDPAYPAAISRSDGH